MNRRQAEQTPQLKVKKGHTEEGRKGEDTVWSAIDHDCPQSGKARGTEKGKKLSHQGACTGKTFPITFGFKSESFKFHEFLGPEGLKA